jgi:carboxyl-terminal processing protease
MLNIIKSLRYFALVCFILLWSTSLQGAPKDQLDYKDIKTIMTQILEEHLTIKQINESVLRHAFRSYIEQFDPQHLYLLEREVALYSNASQKAMNKFLDDYNAENYTPFIDLNKVIQNSIQRAREYRAEIEKNNSQKLFDEAKNIKNFSKDLYIEQNYQRPYAKHEDELKQREEKNIVVFIKEQMDRFGVPAVMQRQEHILKLYNSEVEVSENSYLFVKDTGTAFTEQETEHAMTLHIMKALAKSLDAHTSFFSDDEAYDMRMKLEKGYDGIGIVFKEGLDGVVVGSLIPGGPAEKSGQVNINDTLLSIDGEKVTDESFNTVMDKIRGANGSAVTLELQRPEINSKDSSKFSVKLNREKIILADDRVDTHYVRYGDGIVGEITLHSFYQGDGVSSETDIKNAITELRKHGKLLGLVLDLRDNSGGYLSQAIKVTGLFISDGVVVVSKYSDGEMHVYRDLDGKKFYSGPLVVLTSRLTASAAEIVAESLQDYGVAVIVGDDHTYGKGSIQTQTVTDNKSSSYFKVTVGRYYTVSGKTPQKTGVKADIVVPSQYSKEAIGEAFLDSSLSEDKIAPEYNDDLNDVRPEMKAWYLKYYVPNVQKQVTFWQKLLPTLKENSSFRLEHNKNYQAFLKKLKPVDNQTAAATSDDDAVTDNDESLSGGLVNKSKDFGIEDLQMNEAVNIVKDMILLNSDIDQHFIGPTN